MSRFFFTPLARPTKLQHGGKLTIFSQNILKMKQDLYEKVRNRFQLQI
jgi:hypothetical protein